jgi:protein gp37
MSTGTGIEWTESTWNPIAGCTPVSPGCLNCYAATMAGTRLCNISHQQAKYAGITVKRNGRHVFSGKITFDEKALLAPLKWRTPRMVFVNSMSDLFHEGVPFEFVDRVFAVMALCPQHTFQVLTKRPERMQEYLQDRRPGGDMGCYEADGRYTRHGGTQEILKAIASIDHVAWGKIIPRDFDASWPLKNVWLGVSAENQEQWDIRTAHLRRCPAALRFVSAEPLLGPIDATAALPHHECRCGWKGWLEDPAPIEEGAHRIGVWRPRPMCPGCGETEGLDYIFAGIDWVIVGGESGAGARPCDLGAIRSIVRQGQAADVACFVKQLGSRPYEQRDGDRIEYELASAKGGNPDEWPVGLNVREFPKRDGYAAMAKGGRR